MTALGDSGMPSVVSFAPLVSHLKVSRKEAVDCSAATPDVFEYALANTTDAEHRTGAGVRHVRLNYAGYCCSKVMLRLIELTALGEAGALWRICRPQY